MAIKLATAFAYLSIKEMDRVSIFAVRGNIVEPILEKVVGKDSFLNVIGQINKIEFGGGSQISDAITNSTVGYGDGRSILISDFLTDNDFFNAIDHLRSKKRDVLCLQVLSEEELHPQIRGKSIIRDSEDMGRFYKDNIGRDMLEAYRKALKHVTKRLEDFCISREADYQLVSTKDELKDILLGQLMKKGVIK